MHNLVITAEKVSYRPKTSTIPASYPSTSTHVALSSRPAPGWAQNQRYFRFPCQASYLRTLTAPQGVQSDSNDSAVALSKENNLTDRLKAIRPAPHFFAYRI